MNPMRALKIKLSLCLSFVALLAGTGSAQAQSSIIRVETTQGTIEMQLYNEATPKTAANFLAYVNSGRWVDTFIHRSVQGFVVQLGGYGWPSTGYSGHITTFPAVVNEYSITRSNLRGTVAMAKTASSPDSATSEWFFNLADNSANLDNQNGGFTVFAKVTTAGMVVVDKIAALKRVNAGGAFTDLPYVGTLGSQLVRENVILVTKVTEFPPKSGVSDSDRIFNYLEKTYPEYVPVEGVQSGTDLGYVYRYYPKTNSYVGTKDGQVWYLVPAINNNINALGSLTDFLATAVAAGF